MRHMETNYAKTMNEKLYGKASVCTKAERDAMQKGYTIAERKAISGKIFGIYPQATSQEHAEKLDQLNFG